MEYIKLKDLCEKEERFVAPNDDAHIDYVDISSVDNKSKSLTKYDTYIFAEAPSRARKRVKHGDVIVSTVRPNLNAVARFNIQTPHTPIASTGFCVLRHKSDVDPIYIYFFCISPNFVRQMVAKATGASYPAVSDTIVREAKLPKHTAEKRVRIVSTLSKAKEIIEHRRAQLAKLDELVKCRFVEMFGDPVANDKGWPIVTVQDIVTEVKYGTSRPAVAGGKYPYLRMNNITYDGKLDLSDVKRIDVPDDELPKCTVKRGDILFNRTNSKELVGKTCLYDKDELMVLAGFIIRVRVNALVIPEFVVQFMNMPTTKALLFAMCRNAVSQANINAKELQSISIYLPPLDIQKQFSAFTHRIDKLRIVIRQSLDETQKLFDSLMQEYFD